MKWSLTRGQNQWKSLNRQTEIVWSQSLTGGGRLFTRGTNFKVFAGKVLMIWLDGRLRKVVAHGGSTVQYTHLDHWHFELNCNTASAIAQTETSSSCLGKTYC